MATSKIGITEGADVSAATYTFTEDSNTKHAQRVVLNTSAGEAVSASAQMFPVSAMSNDGALMRVSSVMEDAGKQLVSAKQGDAALLRISGLSPDASTFLVSAKQGDATLLRVSGMQNDAANLNVSAKSNDGGSLRVSSVQDGAAALNVSAKSNDGALLRTSAVQDGAAALNVSAKSDSAALFRVSADLFPNTVGGLTVFRSLNLSASQAVKGSAGAVYGYYLWNTSTIPQYVKMYNTSGAINVGTDTPIQVFMLPASAAANMEFPHGLVGFTNGIGIVALSAVADNATTVAAASAVGGNIYYK